MRITESQLRSIIKKELKNILFEGIKLDPNGPPPYGIPNDVINRARKELRANNLGYGTQHYDMSQLPNYIAQAIHGKNATREQLSKYDFLIDDKLEKLIEYSNEKNQQANSQANSPQANQIRLARGLAKSSELATDLPSDRRVRRGLAKSNKLASDLGY